MLQTDAKKEIVLVDEDVAAVEPLRQRLCDVGFAALTVADRAAAFTLIEQRPPHLVIIAWDDSGVAALELMHGVRSANSPSPPIRFMVLSGFYGDEYAVAAFESGADDYLAKPYSLREAVARVGALLRPNAQPKLRALVSCNELVLDAATSRVTAHGALVEIHGIEYRLLEFLMLHTGKTFNRSQLLNHVWGGDSDVDERTVDVNVQRVRKILRNRGCATYLQTIRGFGYRFAPPTSLG